ADLAIVDPEAGWEVRTEDLYQRHRHSPFLGAVLRGVVERTLVRGLTVYRAGEFPAAPGYGQLLRRDGALVGAPPSAHSCHTCLVPLLARANYDREGSCIWRGPPAGTACRAWTGDEE